MHGFRRRWAALIAVALLVAGCGGGSGDTTVTTIGVLGAALDDTAEVSSFRISLSGGMTFKIPTAGGDFSTELDEQNPLAVGEVNSERQHFTFNVGALLGPLAGDFGDLGIEMWADDERIVVDTSDYQHLVDASPSAELGPIAPGIFFIDLVGVEADSPELMEALVGSSTPDLKELALSLPAALATIEQTSTDPPTFVGTTTAARLIEAQGGNVEDQIRSTMAGMALNLPTDVDELTEAFVEVFKNSEAEVVIELDEQGLLSVYWTRQDLSGLFSAMLEVDSLFAGASEQERQEAAQSFKDAVMIVETRVAYEADAGLEVPLPPATTEDRTEEWREFLVNAGFSG